MRKDELIDELVENLLETLLLDLQRGEKLPSHADDILRGGLTHAFDMGLQMAYESTTLPPPSTISNRVTQRPPGDMLEYLTDSEIDGLVNGLEESLSDSLLPEE